jgi:hypothetical protein
MMAGRYNFSAKLIGLLSTGFDRFVSGCVFIASIISRVQFFI